jgi:transposase
MPAKLSQAAREDIELQLRSGTRVDVIATAFRVSERQVYKMRENLHHFDSVAPNPAEFQVQGRPRLATPEVEEAVLDFLLENGKLAYIDEVKFFIEEEFGIEMGWETVRKLVKDLKMTKKVVSYRSCLDIP